MLLKKFTQAVQNVCELAHTEPVVPTLFPLHHTPGLAGPGSRSKNPKSHAATRAICESIEDATYLLNTHGFGR
jgi:hypothetical protein